MSEQSVGSLRMLRVPHIRAFSGDDVDQDPTSLPVLIALSPPGIDPQDSDFEVASWDLSAPTPTAKILVGPGGAITPSKGVYEVYVWVRGVQQSPREPVGKHVVK